MTSSKICCEFLKMALTLKRHFSLLYSSYFFIWFVATNYSVGVYGRIPTYTKTSFFCCYCFVDMVLDNMIASGQLDESIRENVRVALLKRHHHQNEKKFSNRIPLVRSFADIGKKHSDPHLLERNGEISCSVQFVLTCYIMFSLGDEGKFSW